MNDVVFTEAKINREQKSDKKVMQVEVILDLRLFTPGSVIPFG